MRVIFGPPVEQSWRQPDEPRWTLRGVDREQEFREFVLQRSPALLRSAHALVGDRGLVEDLVKTALMKTSAAWDRVSAADDPFAYAHRILFNSDRRINRRHRVTEVLGAAAEPEVPEELIDLREQAQQAMDRLPPRQRAVLVLRFYEDLGVEETAARYRGVRLPVRRVSPAQPSRQPTSPDGEPHHAVAGLGAPTSSPPSMAVRQRTWLAPPMNCD